MLYDCDCVTVGGDGDGVRSNPVSRRYGVGDVVGQNAAPSRESLRTSR